MPFHENRSEVFGSSCLCRSSPTKTKKVKAIVDFPTPTTVRAIREFIGMANFYRSFVPNFSSIAKPLTDLLKSDVPFAWPDGSPADLAFRQLKQILSTEPVLHIFDPDLPCVLWTDASEVGLGAVLQQKTPGNQIRTIAFLSSKLNEAESRYSATERECLAVVRAVEHFRVYLDGIHFTVISDCQALSWVFTLKKANSRLHRWSIRLSAFDFKVVHRPGSANKVADCLSRNPVSLQLDTNAFLKAQQEIANYGLRKPLLINGLIHVRFYGLNQLVVPPSLVPTVLRSFHDDMNHAGIQKMHELIVGRYWWPKRDDEIRRFVKSCHPCQMSKSPNESTLRPTHPIPTPDGPNQIWAIDAVVMGSSAGNTAAKNILTVIDLHSRFVWAKAVRNITKEATVSFLFELFDAVAPPSALLSDNGTNFVSKAVNSLLEKRSVRHLLTPPFRSQANGVCERVQGTIVSALRTTLVERPKTRWSSLLREIVQKMNDTPHSSTGFKPRFLHFGAPPSDLTVEEARKIATQKSRDQQIKRQQLNDSRAVRQDFQVGDLVRYRLPENHPARAGKLSPRFWGPCKITEKLGEDTFKVDQFDQNTKQLVRSFTTHSSRLLGYSARESETFGSLDSTRNQTSRGQLSTITQPVVHHLCFHSTLPQITTTWLMTTTSDNRSRIHSPVKKQTRSGRGRDMSRGPPSKMQSSTTSKMRWPPNVPPEKPFNRQHRQLYGRFGPTGMRPLTSSRP